MDHATSIATMARSLVRHRRVLLETVRLRFTEMYAGSILGRTWVLLFPLLFLCIYLFVFLVVFKFRFPGLSTAGFVLYVFSGLVPYLVFMQVINEATTAVRANLQLVRNIILPIELIPMRIVLSAMVTQISGFAVIVLILAFTGELAPEVMLLPVAVALQFLLLAGLAWMMAPLGMVLTDISQAVNLLSLFLLFISPISFQPAQLDGYMKLVVYLNPIHYYLLPFRAALLPSLEFAAWELAVSAALALGVCLLGLRSFASAKRVLIDAI